MMNTCITTNGQADCFQNWYKHLLLGWDLAHSKSLHLRYKLQTKKKKIIMFIMEVLTMWKFSYVRKAVLFKNAILRFHIYFLASDWDVNFCKVFFSSPKENLTTVLKWTRNLNFSLLFLQQIPIRGQNHIWLLNRLHSYWWCWYWWWWMRQKKIKLVAQELCFNTVLEKVMEAIIKKYFAPSECGYAKTQRVYWVRAIT